MGTVNIVETDIIIMKLTLRMREVIFLHYIQPYISMRRQHPFFPAILTYRSCPTDLIERPFSRFFKT